MARVLIVGCGCRGRGLAAALLAGGHAVRGTTRDPARLAAIEATGTEAAVADPDRLATLTRHLEGVSVLCWLMGTAAGTPESLAAVHGPRLESMLEAIVDTAVRGVVYEAAGSVEPAQLRQGAEVVRRVAGVHRIPAEVVEQEPRRHADWLRAMVAAVGRVLAG